MANKAATKPAAKKRPAKLKPVDKVVEEFGKITPDDMQRILDSLRKPVEPAIEPAVKSSSPWRRSIKVAAVVAGLAVSFVGGVWSTGGWQIGPGPVVRNDVLQQAYDADRATQVAVLRELAKQPFDGTTDDGRKQAGEWFNAQRFRNRPNDFGAYTDRVSDAIAANSEDSLANELEAK